MNTDPKPCSLVNYLLHLCQVGGCILVRYMFCTIAKYFLRLGQYLSKVRYLCFVGTVLRKPVYSIYYGSGAVNPNYGLWLRIQFLLEHTKTLNEKNCIFAFFSNHDF